MAIEYLNPDGAGDATNWTPVGAAANWQCVDDPAPGAGDGDTTYVRSLGRAAFIRDLYSIANPSNIQVADTIESVEVVVGAKRVAPLTKVPSTIAVCIKENAVVTVGQANQFYNWAYVYWTTRWHRRPSDGAAWTLADVQALQAGIQDNLSHTEVRATIVWVRVEYTPAAPATLSQSHFQLYEDDAGLNAGSAVAAEDAVPDSLSVNRTVRLRIQVANTGGVAAPIRRRLEVRRDAGEWQALTPITWQWDEEVEQLGVGLQASDYYDDGDPTTSRLTPVGVFQAGEGKDVEVDTSEASLAAGGCIEDEWCLRFDRMAGDHSYQFRVTDGGTALQTYAQTPAIYIARPAAALPAFGSGLHVAAYGPDGNRKTFPSDERTKVQWELQRQGYYGIATIEFQEDFPGEASLANGDRIEIWLDGDLRYRGYVGIMERNLQRLETTTLTCYGLAERLNSVLICKNYVFPGGTDIAEAFAAIVTDFIADHIPGLDLDIQTTGFAVENLPLGNVTGREAFDDLIEATANQAVWGFDVNPTTGQDRLFLRPRDFTTTHKVQAGKNIQIYSYPPDSSRITNYVKVTGAEAKFPNVLPNPSFEAPKQAEASTANIVENGGFEATLSGGEWTFAGANTGMTITWHRTGDYCLQLGAAGASAQQIDIPVVAGHTYGFVFWNISRVYGNEYHIEITPDAGAPIRFPSAGSYVTTFTSNWVTTQVQFIAPAGSTKITLRIVADTIVAPSEIEPFPFIFMDDLAVYDTAGVLQPGWEIDTSGAVVYEADLLYPDAQHGVYSFRINATTVGGGDWIRLIQRPDDSVSVKAGTYQFSGWIRNRGTSNVTINIVERNTPEGGNEATTLTPRVLSPGWNHVFLAALGRTFASDTQVRMGIQISSPCDLLFDAFYFAEFNTADPQPATFVPARHYEFILSTADASIQNDSGIPDSIKESISQYGMRQAYENIPALTTREQAQDWAKGYFGVFAQPAISHRVVLAGYENEIVPDGQIELLGSGIDPAAIVHVSYSYRENLLLISVDLTSDRTSWESLLKRALQKVSGQARATAAGVVSYLSPVATGAPIGGDNHARAHLLLDTDDHSDVATYLNQAVLTTSSPAFAKVTTPQIDSTAGISLEPAAGNTAEIRQVDPDTCVMMLDNLMRNAFSKADLDGGGVPDYWTFSAGVSRTTTNAHRGKYAIELAKTAAAVDAFHNDFISIDVDLVYELRFEWLCDAANNGQANALLAQVTCYDENQAYLGYSRRSLTGTLTRTRSVYRHTAEIAADGATYRFRTGTRFVRMRFYNNGANNSKTYLAWPEYKPVYHWGGEDTTGAAPPTCVVTDPCIRSADRPQLTPFATQTTAQCTNIINLTQFGVQTGAGATQFHWEVHKDVG